MISDPAKYSRAAFIIAAAAALCVPAEAKESSSLEAHPPSLVNVCLITNDVARLVDFYSHVLRIRAKTTGTVYAEFPTAAGTLAIFSLTAQERYIPRVAEAGKNRTAILEFRVSDVDAEYARLQSLVKTWVKPPTTQPLGNTLHLLPRSRRQPGEFFRAGQKQLNNRRPRRLDGLHLRSVTSHLDSSSDLRRRSRANAGEHAVLGILGQHLQTRRQMAL